MKSVVLQIVLAIALYVGGRVFWQAAAVQQRVADVHQQLAVLRYEDPASEDNDVEQAMGYASKVSWLAQPLIEDVRAQRVTADYWLANYNALTPKRDAAGVLIDKDPQLLFLAANGAFRSAQRQADNNRDQAVKRLETVLKAYVDVLKNSPDHVDAAYNYEYVVRMRDRLAKTRTGALDLKSQVERDADQATKNAAAGDLPLGPTIHGRPGGPPPGTDMSQFKMVIPMRPDERKDNAQDAGKGTEKVRKG